MLEGLEGMKETIAAKDATIEELKSRLGRAGVPSSELNFNDVRSNDVSLLTQALKEREGQIEELQDKLKQATRY